MSVPLLDPSLLSVIHDNEISELACNVGLSLSSELLDAYRPVIAALDGCAKLVMSSDDYLPVVDETIYVRTDIDTEVDPVLDGGGWAAKITVRSTRPTGSLLAGKTVALKDNIALAGVRCTNGCDLPGWTPKFDATVVQRILDNGGIISGKAACESGCWSTVSDTSITGPVRNPYNGSYSCGGSSSGSARLVAGGAVDMALGGDQGGSIRLPASCCGVVGLKPTWGLVPYTGILGVSAVLDHVGPIAQTSLDCAVLLEAIAGPDGIDDRQPHERHFVKTKYGAEVQNFLQTASSKSLDGIKVAVLEEGFQHTRADPIVLNKVRAAIERLRELGADVRSCSIPEHSHTELVWMCALPAFAVTQGLVMNSDGRKQLALAEPAAMGGGRLSQKAFDNLGPAGQNLYLRGIFLQKKYGSSLVARITNMLRKLSDDYDRVLQDVDILVMPTTPTPPCKIFNSRDEGDVHDRLRRTTGITSNTAPFNSSGHPALTLPVGFSPAAEDEKVLLPVGMQLVGKKFDDVLLLKVAAAFEARFDWKTM